MTEVPPKLRILKGAEPDLSAATYQIHDESHTIGNSLRWMLMKNVPHPSENHIHLRIQMYDNLSSLEALLEALENLGNLCDTVENAYKQSLSTDSYERWDERS
ncbi:uncharacterized protein PHACADRAFT_116447 [Phanerochaete carnosa HHB-10118-sp]|uniref:DNA-directed RNA polymerase RBP11-like dimerisation domain-containing protein n=1 Tax=Phanerochaete carnosa (strain HHB-10118-sp) TaxID=650164 RepID=K5WFU6_PHACS|nr:uncharacterized protein PHACADRAFT_116447 [Phanerochaete carnosa HHB-10118-sp]EKM57954.1 hypothetical protein PHACADRAFT_116447 [Phanerochaete carnosa HHB-10118-sp]